MQQEVHVRSISLVLLLLICLPVLASAQPSIVSVVPNSALRGATVDVRITGSQTLFLQDTEVAGVVWLSQGLSRIDATDIAVTSATVLDATFPIPSDAPLGLWSVNVEQVNTEVVSLLDGFTILGECAISDLAAGAQTACVPATNTYTQVVVVTFANPPASGSLVVNGQAFAIGTSPQSVTLTGLPANGAPVNVTANFSANTGCSRTENALFTAPASCAPQCAISDLAAGAQTPCVPATNTYTQVVIVTFSNPPASGNLVVNGQSFAIGTSPQSVTLTGLPANGAPVNVTARFSANTSCSRTENALFTAPASCGQGGAPDCSKAKPSDATLWPPNRKLTRISIKGVTDPDGDDDDDDDDDDKDRNSVGKAGTDQDGTDQGGRGRGGDDGDGIEITITGVTSDEPATGKGDKTCPDAVIRGDGTVELRAERSSKGNGRVYTIHFTATDESGQSCDGTVFVCVPRDKGDDKGGDKGGRRRNRDCVRDETQYDVTRCNSGKLSPSGSPTLPLVTRVEGDQMAILFSTETAGPVDLRVFDLRGRLVRLVTASEFQAGDHVLYWNGRDSNGHQAASGIYIVRVRMEGTSHASKSVWIR